MRRRQKTECKFENNAVEIQIRDKVIEKCKSCKLRRKLLKKGRDLSFRQLRIISRCLKTPSNKQQRSRELFKK